MSIPCCRPVTHLQVDLGKGANGSLGRSEDHNTEREGQHIVFKCWGWGVGSCRLARDYLGYIVLINYKLIIYDYL